jgi:hypothetical protein
MAGEGVTNDEIAVMAGESVSLRGLHFELTAATAEFLLIPDRLGHMLVEGTLVAVFDEQSIGRVNRGLIRQDQTADMSAKVLLPLRIVKERVKVIGVASDDAGEFQNRGHGALPCRVVPSIPHFCLRVNRKSRAVGDIELDLTHLEKVECAEKTQPGVIA